MKIRAILGWALGILVVLMSSAVTGLAFRNTASVIPVSTPEDPTVVLVALGGAGLVWQYLRSRVRK